MLVAKGARQNTQAPTIADDVGLLELMLTDMELQEEQWLATSYWRGYSQRILAELGGGYEAAHGGGKFFDLGAHMVDQILQMVDVPLEQVFARFHSGAVLDLDVAKLRHIDSIQKGRITTLMSKVPAFRAMHIHGRALQLLLPRAVDDLESRVYLDGEVVAGMVLGYNEPLSHLMQAGGDAILVPSRFEPCGLTQLYGLRYGCVPVVAHTGGLADTVIDANEAALAAGAATGFHFGSVTADALKRAVHRTIRAFEDKKTWAQIQKQGMKSDVSWERSALRYTEIYTNLIKK